MRLIDADSLMKIFTYNPKGEKIPERDCDNFPITVNLAYVKQCIREAETIKVPETSYNNKEDGSPVGAVGLFGRMIEGNKLEITSPAGSFSIDMREYEE